MKTMKTIQVIEALAKQNPEALNNPRAQSLLNILRSGDEQRGIEAANNILKELGLNRETGVQQATSGIQEMLPHMFGRR